MDRTNFVRHFSLIIVIAITMTIAAPGARAQSNQKVIELKLATPYPPTQRIVTDGYEIWIKEIEKRTNGRVKITSFHGGTLVKMLEARDALIAGVADIGQIGPGLYPHLYPIGLGLTLPFMAESANHAAEIGKLMWEQIPQMRAEYEDFHMMGLFSGDVTNLSTVKKHVKKLDDMEGLRIASFMPQVVNMAKHWPCSSMLIPAGDLYVSLQRNVVDGVLFPNAPMRAFKLTDFVSKWTIGNFFVMPATVVIRKQTWDKLSRDIQKVFEDLDLSFTRLLSRCLTNEGLSVIEALKKRGDDIYYLSPAEIKEWRKPLAPIYEGWVEDLNKRGWDGQAILEKMWKISDEAKKNPYTKIDEWWSQGHMGK